MVHPGTPFSLSRMRFTTGASGEPYRMRVGADMDLPFYGYEELLIECHFSIYLSTRAYLLTLFMPFDTLLGIGH
jgi:hypothetical protein